MNNFKSLFAILKLCAIFSLHTISSSGQNVSENDSLVPLIYKYNCQDSFLDTVYLIFGRGFAGDKVVVSHSNNLLVYSHVFYDSTFNNFGKIYYLKNHKTLYFNIGVSEFKYNYNLIWSPKNEEDAITKIEDYDNYPRFFYSFQYLDIKVNLLKGKYLYFTLEPNSRSKYDKYNLVRPYSRLELKYEQLKELPNFNN